MLKDAARALSALHSEGTLDQLIEEARLDGADGFYAAMKAVPAFAEDRLEKKARVLAHDVFREQIINFRDPENLRPAVEYHLLRLYLRTGRVYPTEQCTTAPITRKTASSKEPRKSAGRRNGTSPVLLPARPNMGSAWPWEATLAEPASARRRFGSRALGRPRTLRRFPFAVRVGIHDVVRRRCDARTLADDLGRADPADRTFCARRRARSARDRGTR